MGGGTDSSYKKNNLYSLHLSYTVIGDGVNIKFFL